MSKANILREQLLAKLFQSGGRFSQNNMPQEVSFARPGISLRPIEKEPGAYIGQGMLKYGNDFVTIWVGLHPSLVKMFLDDGKSLYNSKGCHSTDLAITGLNFSVVQKEQEFKVHASEGATKVQGGYSPFKVVPAWDLFISNYSPRSFHDIQVRNGQVQRLVKNQESESTGKRLSCDFWGGGAKNGWGFVIPQEGHIMSKSKALGTAADLGREIASNKFFVDPYFGIQEDILQARAIKLALMIEELAEYRQEAKIPGSYSDEIEEMFLNFLSAPKDENQEKGIKITAEITYPSEDELENSWDV